ncbi:AAA family ATPase [Arcicella sp. DC2W]|uniref:AAA family ATPase n=1 Tax=Arcicella gelida TaxID=2984195 RepID=A0ABU5S9K5_9BACT|nr:AAA family ATPase [Arcicella sp. DC2W]MEA5405160.1 AAA family ATPase [Arcicella sp. DC2W]
MLRKVRIQNFKSLKDVTLELQKVNLLIGPNNSGKSNFLKGLEFVSYDFEKMNESDILRLKYKGIDFNEIDIHVVADKFDYVGIFPENPYINFYATTKNLSKSKVWHSKTVDFQSNFPNENHEDNMLNKFNIELTTIIYKPDPNTFTKPASLESANTLLPDCSNLVPFLFNLSQNHKKLFKNLEDNLAKCVGDLVSIGTPADGNKLKLKFFDKDDNDYWADEVSEGVLYFLAVLCIIHQPNPPILLLLEEPEKGIHPRRIHEIMKFIFQLVEDKDIQVIMTSHNEHVLEEFTTMPESVFIFDKDDEGATFVKNLQKDIIEPGIIKAKEFGIEPIDYTDNIGENWFMGLMGGVPA